MSRNPSGLLASCSSPPGWTASLLMSSKWKTGSVLHEFSPLRDGDWTPRVAGRRLQGDISSTLQAVRWESRLSCGSAASRAPTLPGEKGWDSTHYSSIWLSSPYHMHLTSFRFWLILKLAERSLPEFLLWCFWGNVSCWLWFLSWNVEYAHWPRVIPPPSSDLYNFHVTINLL